MRRLACLLMVLLLASPLAGQGPGGRALAVTARRDLAFGQLMAGLAAYVGPATTQSGQYEVRGNRNVEVQVLLTLPTGLTLATGEQLPLAFGAADGLASSNSNPRGGTAFDPRSPLLWRLPNNGRLFIFLGGTAQPALTQRSGFYRGTVTLTVAYTGN